MTNKTNKKLKIILPIVILILLIGILILILIPKSISQNNYFTATNSKYTKQVQNTTIVDGQAIVYEKIETLIIDGSNIYHKIEEKKTSSSLDKEYDEIVVEYYYSKSKMYYKENDTWQTIDFKVKNNLKRYILKTEYFITFEFDKKFEEIGTFSASVKDEHINDVFNSETKFNTASLTLTVNKNFKIQSLNIIAKTEFNKDVSVRNIYTYLKETVNLPNI